jgi:hypothetical protein
MLSSIERLCAVLRHGFHAVRRCYLPVRLIDPLRLRPRKRGLSFLNIPAQPRQLEPFHALRHRSVPQIDVTAEPTMREGLGVFASTI